MPKPFAIAGAGFSGAVLARELAEKFDRQVVVFDKRPHIAGNCHTERDPKTGVMVHQYGPHIFNTSREDVWNYVNRFATMYPFVNRVKAQTARGMFSLPINLLTINQLFGKTMNPAEAAKFIAGLAGFSGAEPANFEEQALKFVGREIYETFFYGYTKKQWGCEPRELPASILKRLPVRFNYDDNYYASRFQGIPTEGYTEMIRRILEHPRIVVILNQPIGAEFLNDCEHLFYTGCIDEYYGFSEGRLNYRTVYWSRIDAEGDYQGNAVINYCEAAIPHTRIHEHKHFAPWEDHARTVAFVEYSKQTEPADVPYYPMRLPADMRVLDAYTKRAAQEIKVTFLGRLATYRYLDMDKVIGEALDLAAKIVSGDVATL